MTTPQWTSLAVSVLVAFIGLSIQGAMLAYFLGRMKQHQESQAQLVNTLQNFTQQAIEALTGRLGRVDEFTAESKSDRSNIRARLASLEANTRGLPGFREDFAAFSAGSKAHQERLESDVKRLNAGVDALQRQMANLALHGPGKLVEMPASKL